MFRFVASAALNPSFGADSHTPDVGGHSAPCTPDWIMEIACWLACPLTCYVSSSRSWMQPPVWFIIWELATTSLTHLSVSNGCEPQNRYCAKCLFWHTKPCMEAHHAKLVHWSMSLMCLVDQHSALPDRTVCGFRRSNCQPSTVERFRSRQHSSGTGWPTMSRQPIRRRLSFINWNTRCSSSHCQTLSRDIS